MLPEVGTTDPQSRFYENSYKYAYFLTFAWLQSIIDKFPDGYEDVGTIVKNTTTITSGEIIKN